MNAEQRKMMIHVLVESCKTIGDLQELHKTLQDSINVRMGINNDNNGASTEEKLEYIRNIIEFANATVRKNNKKRKRAWERLHGLISGDDDCCKDLRLYNEYFMPITGQTLFVPTN